MEILSRHLEFSAVRVDHVHNAAIHILEIDTSGGERLGSGDGARGDSEASYLGSFLRTGQGEIKCPKKGQENSYCKKKGPDWKCRFFAILKPPQRI